MATEYIKKEDALNAFRRVYMIPSGSKAKDIYPQQIINTYRKIESIPAVDVVPRELYELALSDVVTLSAERKQGKWIVMNDDYIDDCKCSECGCIEYFNRGWKRFNFCPNCGAQMESGDK